MYVIQDPEEFYQAYDEMMDYVQKSSNWPQMEEELKGRGVSYLSFSSDPLNTLELTFFNGFFTKLSML